MSVNGLVITPQRLNRETDFPISPAYRLKPGRPTPGWPTLLRHPFTQMLIRQYRNINLLSITYAFRPRLRCRLTLGGLTFPRNPWAFGVPISHRNLRYSCQHNHFQFLQHSLRCTFTGYWKAPLPRAINCSSTASVMCLAPLHFRHRPTRPVSCYAFFKGWLLLSQPPGCLGVSTSFAT